MEKQYLFNFKSDFSEINIPLKLNNPFSLDIPEIAQIASQEFQEFLKLESMSWEHDFSIHKGKMFGVLVIETDKKALAYIGTVSGKLMGISNCNKFIPSVFDDSTDDYYFTKGMTALTEMGQHITTAVSESERQGLLEKRKLKSLDLQNWLFENYIFLNSHGESKSILDIFKASSHGNPPSAAGECAAPKLLEFAFKHKLKPIAIAEFWWGNSSKNEERQHKTFYPACKDKCRPILEYMLDNMALYENATLSQ